MQVLNECGRSPGRGIGENSAVSSPLQAHQPNKQSYIATVAERNNQAFMQQA